MSKFGLAVFMACFLSNVAAQEFNSVQLEVAAGATAPAMTSNHWQQISPSGIELDSPTDSESFWVRVKSSSTTEEWSIYGPFRGGDTIAIEDGSNDFILGFAEKTVPDKSSENKSFGPRITIGSSRTRIGPIVFDTPKIPMPKFPGSGGGSGTKPDSNKRIVVLEEDPEPTHDAYCGSPMRLRNTSNQPVALQYEEIFWNEGVGCDTTRTTKKLNYQLKPKAVLRLGCSTRRIPSQTCSWNKKWRNVIP